MQVTWLDGLVDSQPAWSVNGQRIESDPIFKYNSFWQEFISSFQMLRMRISSKKFYSLMGVLMPSLHIDGC